MAKTSYFIVEQMFVARLTTGPNIHNLERWSWPDGTWMPYDDDRTVMENGCVVDEATAQKFIAEHGPKE